LVKDQEAMKHFGSTMALWDFKAMKPTKILAVPGAPLEIRWSLNPQDNWAVTATALTSKLWLIKQDASGNWQGQAVADIGDPAKIPLPVDISISADGKGLWVNTFMDGKTRYFDLSNPAKPVQAYEKVTGKQVNMISQSWDGKRVYISSSLLARPDARAQELGFVPPAPGTYKLQHILRAPEGTVLDCEGAAQRFSRFTTGRITVLSLIYTRCGDGRGCPLASYMLKSLKARIDKRRRWSDLLRFVSLSFDPDHDTPAVMRAYGGGYAPDRIGLPWHFLTTRSHRELRLLLDGFGQDVWMPADPSAPATGPL